MITRLHSTLLAILLGLTMFAACKESPLQIRAVLMNPAKPDTKIFVSKADGHLIPLKLVDEGLSEPQKVFIDNGNLNLFASGMVDKSNPLADLAATIKIPEGSTRLIVIIVPSSPGLTPPYRLMVLDDDPKSFPWGECRAINLTSFDFSLEVGAKKVPLPGDKVTAIPKVTKVDEFNRAYTSFYYKQQDQWLIANELQMQYIDTLRRVIVIYQKPGAFTPEIRFLADQQPVAH